MDGAIFLSLIAAVATIISGHMLYRAHRSAEPIQASKDAIAKLVVASLLASVSCKILAADDSKGMFSCHAYGDAGCAEHIRDLVTDKFTARFPYQKYEIVAIYDMQLMSNGGGVGFAIVGVSPKLSDSKRSLGNGSLMPSRRFTSTSRVAAGERINPYQRTKYEISDLRDAVEAMMEACEREASCNVLGKN